LIFLHQALAESRAIIVRLRRRQLYKQVDVKVLPGRFKELWEPHLTPENIAAEATRIPLVEGIDGAQTLKPEDIIVDWSTLHMGLKEKDPMQYVKFYSKQQPNCMFLPWFFGCAWDWNLTPSH
jgi:deoxynucleoside triphosphate triphosphohydrolase SAMHD1